jgi:LmbE family N-acetylglucosaminyl deacetylase
MSVLVIAPHPDDEVIGCGGAIRSRIQSGARVTAVFLTSGELGLKHLARDKARRIREREAGQAAAVLGLAELHFLRQPDWILAVHATAAARALQPVLESTRPKVVYLPHPSDGHPDHQASLAILGAALRRCRNLKPELLGYEIWTPLTAHDVVVDITKAMPRKLRALRAHRSQLREFDYVKAMTGLNQFRGALAGKCRFAEVFQTLSLHR